MRQAFSLPCLKFIRQAKCLPHKGMFSLKKDKAPDRTAVRPDKPSLAQLIARRFIAVLLALATAGLLGIVGSMAYYD